MEDGEAIRKVLGGEIEAFEALVERHHARCLGYARRLLGNHDLAEDVVQETFLRAYRGLRGYDDRNRFGAWLFRILVNRCRSTLKQRAHRAAEQANVTATARGEPRATEGDPMARMTILAALERLAPDQREAFLLHHVEELSYEEMAYITGAGISALKMRVARARGRLQQEIR